MASVIFNIFGVGIAGTNAFFQKNIVNDGKTYISSCPKGSSETKSSNGDKYCVTDYNFRPKDITQYENYANFDIIPNAVITEESLAQDVTLNQESGEGIPKCRITPEENCSSSSISSYAGCGRTVCNELVANSFCSKLDWGGNDCKDEEGNNISCLGQWKVPNNNVTIANGCYSSSSDSKCTNIVKNDICYCPSNVWGASNCTCTNGKRYQSVRCALLKSKSIKTYIIHSGGGGSAGAAVRETTATEALKKCIDFNMNCYIKLTVGKGSAYQGQGDKTIAAIYDSGNNLQWRRQILSCGYPGEQGQNATKDKVGSSIGYVSCRSDDTSCYVGGAVGVGECYGHIQGIPRENGIKSPTNETEIFTPAQGGSGGKNAEYDGVSYGNGGDGGSVLSENPTAEEMRGKPSGDGHIVLEYVLLYKGASGGGGGGAGYAIVKDIEVTPNQEYEIEIGGGGKGGIENEDGIDGGDTVVKFGSSVYIAHGGKGGRVGKSEDDVSDKRIAGIGGEGGKIEGVSASAGIGGSQEGQRGTDGTIDGDYIATGGLGGRSGISMSTNIVYAACGGLYFDNNISCLNQDNHNGLGAEYLNPMEKKPEHIYKESSLGSYGAGGGGGGWKYVEYTGADSAYGVFAGKGGDGQGGYVYLWW